MSFILCSSSGNGALDRGVILHPTFSVTSSDIDVLGKSFGFVPKYADSRDPNVGARGWRQSDNTSHDREAFRHFIFPRSCAQGKRGALDSQPSVTPPQRIRELVVVVIEHVQVLQDGHPWLEDVVGAVR